MSARVGFWLAGLILGIVSGGTVPESLFPASRPVVFGATFLLIGLLGECLTSLHTVADPSIRHRRDMRSPDGRVELARVAGLRREPNPVDSRFGVFLDRETPVEPPGVHDPSRRHASPPLLGRVVIVSLFVGRDGRAWSASEIVDAHQALLRAGTWLEAEAIRLGAAVNLELADTYFVYDDDSVDDVALGYLPEGNEVGPFEEGATLKALVTASRAAAALGFRDAQDLFQNVADRVQADASVWLMHPRRAGRSFAVPFEDSALDGVSLAVCYPRESSFPEALRGPARVDPVTVVHELLHLFGATDKYGRPLRDFAPRSVSSREVMRLSETRLSRLRIDPFTAAEIGWSAPRNRTADAHPEG